MAQRQGGAREPDTPRVRPAYDTTRVSNWLKEHPVRAETTQIFPGFAKGFAAACNLLGGRIECSPMATDDQSFKADNNNAHKNVGPHAYVAPSALLDSYTEDADFTTTKWVGFVFLKDKTSADTYQKLKLSYPYTCIYLQSVLTAPDPTYTAHMQSSADGNCPTTYTATPGDELPVKFARVPPPHDGGSNYDKAHRIPPVARFHEGSHGAGHGVPLIGVKCGNKWCVILPSVATHDTLPLPHSGLHANRKTWAVHGWHDAQYLAKETSPGSAVFERTNHEGSIVPDEDLVGKVYLPLPITHVATIHFKAMPSGVYRTGWNFWQGENDLYLGKSGSGWSGVVCNRGPVSPANPLPCVSVRVKQLHAGTHPPATARFTWDKPDDEGIWVECDGGCCYVTL